MTCQLEQGILLSALTMSLLSFVSGCMGLLLLWLSVFLCVFFCVRDYLVDNVADASI